MLILLNKRRLILSIILIIFFYPSTVCSLEKEPYSIKEINNLYNRAQKIISNKDSSFRNKEWAFNVGIDLKNEELILKNIKIINDSQPELLNKIFTTFKNKKFLKKVIIKILENNEINWEISLIRLIYSEGRLIYPTKFLEILEKKIRNITKFEFDFVKGENIRYREMVIKKFSQELSLYNHENYHTDETNNLYKKAIQILNRKDITYEDIQWFFNIAMDLKSEKLMLKLFKNNKYVNISPIQLEIIFNSFNNNFIKKLIVEMLKKEKSDRKYLPTFEMRDIKKTRIEQKKKNPKAIVWVNFASEEYHISGYKKHEIWETGELFFKKIKELINLDVKFIKDTGQIERSNIESILNYKYLRFSESETGKYIDNQDIIIKKLSQ